MCSVCPKIARALLKKGLPVFQGKRVKCVTHLIKIKGVLCSVGY